MSSIIGRKIEIERLDAALDSDRSELIAVYGRRRVGKTFLIRECYKKRITFEISGLYNGTFSNQLANFHKSLGENSKKLAKREVPKSWLAAFSMLEEYLSGLKRDQKKVVFIDEFPWLATAKSGFLTAFENFWNSYATKRTDLIIVICGSAASYMLQKIIRNKGGLHNRITYRMRLMPFNLYETKLFLKSKNISYTHYDIIQLYMVMGGIPHYLEKIKKGDSVAQNVDRLCFEKDGVLVGEFHEVFASLFNDSDKHVAIIKALSTSRQGITRDTIIKITGNKSSGDISRVLDELIESGFVSRYTAFGKKTKSSRYRLSDEYSLFYLKFIANNRGLGKGTWQNQFESRSYSSWCGFSFETLCLKHIDQIKMGLNIQAIYSISSNWSNENAQIDLLIDRADNIINICELKFSQSPFKILNSYAANLKNKIGQFKSATKTRKNVYLTMVTTYGIEANKYSLEIVENELKMDCLFQD